MKDKIIEETAVCANYKGENFKYNLITFFSFLSLALVLIWFLVCYSSLYYEEGGFFGALIVTLLPSILFLIIGILLFRFRDKFCADYDYAIVSGSVRVSKIVKGIKRYPLITFESNSITKIGIAESQSFLKICSDKSIKVLYASSNSTPTQDKDFYYIVTVSNGIKYVVVMECTKKFINHILAYCNKGVKDSELKWFI